MITSITTWVCEDQPIVVITKDVQGPHGHPNPQTTHIYSPVRPASLTRLAHAVYQHQIDGSATVRPCLSHGMFGWTAEVRR
jgi:hypothetical protein